jgi:transcriptional regulator with XRE-family HTH domain
MNFFLQRREQLGKTQREIALALEMTTSAVSSWERGIAVPKIGLADKLAAVYQVSADRIIKEIAALAREATSAASA